MNKDLDENARRILTLLLLDAQRLYERITERDADYLRVFSLKRTRDHFPEVFYHRYRAVPIEDLKHCNEEIIIGLDKFYTMADDIHWYLSHTEDMPAKATDLVQNMIRDLSKTFNILQFYINAELGYQQGDEDEEEAM
jgi:hypothetical protein